MLTGNRNDLTEWKREALDGYRPLSWTDADFEAHAAPRADAGVLRVRVGRVSLDADARGRSLTVILVPVMEPRYEVDACEMTIDKLTLGGKDLKPERLGKQDFQHARQISRMMARRDHGGGFAIQPASSCLFSCPAPAITAGGEAATIEGAADLTLRVPEIVTLPFEKISKPHDLTENVSISAEMTDSGVSVKLSGTTDSEDRRYYKEDAISFLGKDGEALTANTNRTSSSSNNGVWECTLGMSLNEKPAKIRVKTPGQARELTLPFKIRDVRLPGGGGGQ